MNITFVVVATLIGVVFAIIVPILVDILVQYKQNKSEKGYEDNKTSVVFSRIYSLFVSSIFTYLALTCFPIWKVSFLIIYCLIACVGTFVDNRIRIIANEMVLFMLFLAIPYRLIDGGLSYLFNSFVSMIGIFGFLVVTFFVCRIFMTSLIPGGAGDLKLMMTLAFLLGYPNLITGVFVTALVMSAYIFLNLFMRRITLKSYIPMAGFIMIGILVGFLNGGMDIWEMVQKTITF